MNKIMTRLFTVLMLIFFSMGAQADDIISDLSGITDPEGSYILSSSFSTTGERVNDIGSSSNPFKGTIDGQLVTITGAWDKPLFDYVEDATIKNVIIGNAFVSGSACVGAIAGTAKGATRIYNCGILNGSVGSTGDATDNPKSANACGGLVGVLDDNAHVVNCYSYATITGGNRVGGVVGYNKVKTTAATVTTGTMVMNCMFYGDITGGNKVSPVYGGENISNLKGGLTTFNYYAYDKLKTKKISGETFYNCALAVEERFLNRFEIYRQLLNSNKKLAAWYATESTDNGAQMAKWVLETADRTIDNPKPYPILKAQDYYPSIINPDFANAPDSSFVGPRKGGKLGSKTLSVTISTTKTAGGQDWPSEASVSTTSLTLIRTDMDGDRFNFNYDKVQLPYYNDVGSGNYTGGRVVTGWMITGMTVGEGDDVAIEGTFTAKDEWNGYNFADRKTYAKDLYSKSGRVFSQGAYFDVPYGVTAITIEPYWGKAAFLADQYYDKVFDTGYGAEDVKAFGNQVDNSTTYNGVSVKTDINSALGTISSPGSTVYDNAIVLVGNFHQCVINNKEPFKSGTTPFTIMSVDKDNDHEPDYSLIFHDNNRSRVPGIRFDFLNIPGTAQAQKPNGADKVLNTSVFNASSWFEITNTCNIFFSQFEYENSGKTANSPIILLGGAFDQFTSTKTNEVKNTTYLHVGSNAWFKDFANGTHSDGSKKTKHIPISVTGGEYKGFYLTGTYSPGAAVYSDDAECYISSGHFVEAAGAGQEQINGNVRWQIYNAYIENFFGGGINSDKPIKGNITIDIFNSYVDTYCGGPKFGDMQTINNVKKKVTTNATGCVFGKFFGAGFGGTALTRLKYYDQSNLNFANWQTKYSTTDKGKYFDGITTPASYDSNKDYGKKGPGVASDFDYEFFVWTSGVTGGRFFVKFASFSLAKCNDVESTLTGCTIKENFYGGGNLGSVSGTAKSVLDGCTVNGNVFGGGYSATLPTIEVRDAGFDTSSDHPYPTFNKYSGLFEPGNISGTKVYEWKHVDKLPDNNTTGTATENNKYYLLTDVDLTALGKVGATDLTIKGNTKVEGSVFGGGDESAISPDPNYSDKTIKGDTKVKIQNAAVNTSQNTISNVYGGGNIADVDGDTEVTLENGTISQDIFGGGKGEPTVVGGNVTVNIGTKTGTAPDFTYEGTGTARNVYGGSALGAVNAKKEGNSTLYSGTNENQKTTSVNIYAGTINESVYGGGLGHDDTDNAKDIAAKNFGNTTVTVENSNNSKALVNGAVYGGANVNGVLEGNATVTITGGTVGTAAEQESIVANTVFGGGKGQPTLVKGEIEVNIGTSNQATGGAIFHGNVYGGSALGNTNAIIEDNKVVSNPDKHTLVNLYAGTINGNVFGGGLGQKDGVNNATSDIESIVGGDVTVTLDGAKLVNTFTGTGENRVPVTGQIFGANNLNGTPKGHVKIWVKRTVDCDKSSTEALAKTREQRTTYDVAAVYGGGNQADYIPTGALIALPAPEAEDYQEKLEKKEKATAEVLIEGCDKTSIDHVYGGGNAAAVPATEVTVKGTYIINTLYGGGNGSDPAKPGANVGTYNNGATGYGTGKAVTKLLGGYINSVYGGSNTKGDVRGGVDVRTKKTGESVTGDCCATLNVGKVYGAGSHADVNSDVNITLECMPEDYVDAVYGGAEQAIVKGNVTLQVTSGKFGRVFGGNNKGGDIRGSITVYVNESGCKPLIIGELYGGGNEAPYSIYGCTQDGDSWTANEDGTLYFDETTEGRAAVQVNVVACTSIGKVFGGGNQADVIGNTHVWINMMKGYIEDPANPGFLKENALGKIGQVFGGGNAARVKGNITIDIGTSLASEDNGVKIEGGSGYLDPTVNSDINIDEAGIYGGGYSADVDGDATLNIGTENLPLGVNIAGNIYGGGFGETTHVTGDVVVNIGKKTGNVTDGYDYVGYANITGDVYGGSAKGKVNSHLVSSVETATTGKETHVSFYGGTITGNLYGGGYGEDNAEADVYGPITVNVYKSSSTDTNVKNVFGGNNLSGVARNSVSVNISGGTISENVYGGGNAANVLGDVAVKVTAGSMIDVYGGGKGQTTEVGGDVTVDIGEKNESTSAYSGTGTITGSVYGGSALGTVNTTANKETKVNIYSGTVDGSVYGGGLGQLSPSEIAAQNNGHTTVTIENSDNTKALVKTAVYGGANTNGVLKGNATVTIIGGTVGTTPGENEPIANVVFGGGKGQPTLVEGNVAVNIGKSEQTEGGAIIHGSVYGGSALGNVNAKKENDAIVYAGSATTSVTMNIGTVNGDIYGGGLGDASQNVAANVYGPVTVTVTKGLANNVFGCNNIYGAPQHTVTVNINGTDAPDEVTRPLPIYNIYGGGNQAAYTYTDATNPQNLRVNISGGTMDNVFGGGLSAEVAGGINVSISGGTVKNDVYGGGALANTNTANWSTSGSAMEYVEVTGLTSESSVAGYYTKSGSVYTLVTTGTAATGTAYYKKKVVGTWVDGMNDETNGTKYKTNVILTGGLLGNVYGGGLGDGNHAAMVYGDVKVAVNDPTVIGTASGVAFTQETKKIMFGEGDKRKEYIIPLTGRVFGCNNQNGTPTGNVRVELYSTRQIDADDNIISGHGASNRKYQYEMQAVYGGGNLSDYLPADGKGTSVYIGECDVTSIEKVYGGGNSASVPATDVTINGTYDLGYAFGGGNGGDLIYKNDEWIENEGAIVIGLAKITPKGGKIGQVFGGSDAKGVCGSTAVDLTKQNESNCPLVLTRIYGAGNEADVANGVNMIISGCTSGAATIGGQTVNTQIEYVYGGSYNAHITGDVTLTITSGIFKYVYGGNDRTGSISGNITVNIEETEDCKPIIIESLLGGGNEAPYPGTKRDGTEITTPGKITVNVKSATYIGNVFGGSYKADVNGDTEVNINMTRGLWAGKTAPEGYSNLPNVHENVIDNSIGTIGEVYGGGNQGVVRGNSTVNIGTSTTVPIKDQVTKDTQGNIISITYKNEPVYGAHIMGDVFGGGNLADVKGNAEVNICAKYDDVNKRYDAVAEGTDKVIIGGNVFGGGKGIADSFRCAQGMVGVDGDGVEHPDGGTTVNIGNGTVGTLENGTLKAGSGNVYGGGKVGRVEKNTVVTIGLQSGAASAPIIEGNIFGAGQGVNTHGYSALVRGTSTVTVQGDAKVKGSVYGGGEIASVGRYQVADEAYHAAHPEVGVGMPYSLVDETSRSGFCTVIVQDNAEIGPDNMEMPTFSGHVFGGGKGTLPYEGYSANQRPWRMLPSGSPEYYDDIDTYETFIQTLALATQTDVTISGNAFIKGSVYGGSENGIVQHDTHVTIAGGQIGNGWNPTLNQGVNLRYTTDEWAYDVTSNSTQFLYECNSWPYGKNIGTEQNPQMIYAPYDPNAHDDGYYYNGGTKGKYAEGGLPEGSDGHTYYGNVFGGGSGNKPYKDRATGESKWHRKAGTVYGNTYVNIMGGHILTSVYGGNEHTDVGKYTKDNHGVPIVPVVNTGKCTVTMTGGTLGVPRTLEQIAAHPVTCYLFGAGKGDQRMFFNTWTNVISTEVNISGTARIYGSAFGGGEDGHVMGDAVTNISDDGVRIGTWGTSYVDGNVFGGGRGFSGEALTAGTVGGNVEVNITGGTMLGSVYGGGRLASVGTYFTDPTDDLYGQFQEDGNGKTYGHVKVKISGGTIGNASPVADSDYSNSKYSGNVYGGSMGRLKLLDGSINPIWPELAQVKSSSIDISGGTFIRNVYGGGEYGIVRENAYVTIGGIRNETTDAITPSGSPTINGCVFGGGYGSDDYQHPTTIDVHWGGTTRYYTYTPMQWAGCVGGNTIVNIAGGSVGQNVYGGGELASVGIIDYSVEEDEDGPFTYKGERYSHVNIEKHNSHTDDGKESFYNFGLSWPYKFTYVPCVPGETEPRGETIVNITGGSIGTTGSVGYVFGGGKGQVAFGTTDAITEQRYIEAFCANVRRTHVTIGTNGGNTTPTIGLSVYGGGDNGHVYEDASVTIHKGLIAHSVFGGGKGEDTYKTTLWDTATGNQKTNTEDVCSWTAGKVYGNTSITMYDGNIGWFIYGGGNMASVGKGNYTGGTDDYAPNGYGELPSANGEIWTANPEAGTYAYYFQNSGKSTVTVLGGTVGSAEAGDDSANGGDGIPYGSVFGGSRGRAAKTIRVSPRYKYGPDFFLGYVNKASINIGGFIEDGVTTLATGDGPTIYGSVYGGGQDGHVRNSTEVKIFKGNISGQTGAASDRSGNVFGAGSGIGKYQDGENKYCNNASGSVTCTTLVEVIGGNVAGSVYGGGALASVGPPNTGTANGQGFNELNTLAPYTKRPDGFSTAHGSLSYNLVKIEGGTIGGSVYGASRGPGAIMFPSPFTGIGAADNQYNPTMYATSIWTEVNVTGGTIGNNVYGGGEMGQVKESTKVNLTGGSIAYDVYGGGKGTKGDYAIAADVGGNTTVELNKGVASSAKGCSLQRIFGCNDLNGTPKGHVLVHVYATRHKAKDYINEKYVKFKNLESDYTISNYAANTNDDDLEKLATTVGMMESEISGYKTEISNGADDNAKKAALEKYIDAIADKKYDVLGVYGGGDLAIYEPTGNNENTEVIIEGCDVTSIKQVYGGGNAASTPATHVRINSAYEIHEAFGGGNGKDNYEIDGKWYENPGANVGYYATYHHDTSSGGTQGSPYSAVENNGSNGYADASTAEARRVNYPYGKGTANLEITGGRIHMTYGGSNIRGNIRAEANTGLEDAGLCTMAIDKSYTAGKSADTDAGAHVESKCVDYQAAIYGGSKDANVYNDVVIDITNGTYGKIFGGNDTSGKIYGSITINVNEEGCKPIVIGELYGGGFNADYSIYGFNADGSARTKAQYDALSDSEKAAVGIKQDPRINIISATKIGTIYGGGYQAKVIGSPHVNVNMTEGFVAAKYVTENSSSFAQGEHPLTEHDMDCSYYVEKQEGGKAILRIGTIGTIYGGGYKGDVQGNTSVEIGTGEWLNQSGQRETTDADGKVYTYNSTTEKWDWIKQDGETTTSGTVDHRPVPSRDKAKITGNVYGGGEGVADTWECEKAMVGINDEGKDVADPSADEYKDKGTKVIIGNGSVGGSVFGGGKIGRVEWNTAVTIGLDLKEGEGTSEEDGKSAPTIAGNVFGAGAGVSTQGYSALVRGNSTVTIQGDAKIGQSVYGGGQLATVGRYNVSAAGIPESPKSGGVCTVTIRGNAEIGPDDMVMTKSGGPDDFGHVFGACMGVVPGNYTYTGDNKPQKWPKNGSSLVYIATEADYLSYLETLALASNANVTIGDNAWVKGSVYGGSENGYVQADTHVTIEGDCQIGNGYVQMAADGSYLGTKKSVNRRYTDAEWTAGHLIDAIKDGTTAEATGYTSSLPECASWPYGTPWYTYDKFAGSSGYDAKDGAVSATDGHTFYGNVFGGGSGYWPYAAGKWHKNAGSVGGNTYVNITGGHILTNVYGGNEMTNVTGDVTINFGGTATLGVPRTLGQITAHPVTCYLFGGGKGDPRVFFNKQTNVQNVTMNVTGGWIYGSVFGGGEDGHVMRNVNMTISDDTSETKHTSTKIGTWGTSYVDGNVFGGGRGFAGDTYTAGNIAGSVTMSITGGEVLGSVYGGGRLGSVGYGLYEANETGKYGTMRPDYYADDGTTSVADFKRGYVTMNISGGTIGNKYEYQYIAPEVMGDALATAKANMPSTQFESNNRLKHTRGGNVYAGGMGRYTQLDGSTPISAVDWWKLGNVKSTTLNISGDVWIMGNVYGGGELGAVTPYTSGETVQGGTTTISITGGTIGTEITEATPEKETVAVPESGSSTVKYTYGSVYGGGMGMDEHDLNERHGGEVKVNTMVSMSGTSTKVRASVYGGGEMAHVGGNTNVTISGGEIGRNEVRPANDENPGYVMFGGATMGNVYGGGKGTINHVHAGLVKGNTNVTINAGETEGQPFIYHNVYGGGALASVGTFGISTGTGDQAYIPAGIPYGWTANTGRATVTINGGTIGISGRDNGMVNGSSRGDIEKPDPTDRYDKLAWVNDAIVTIGEASGESAGPRIKGSVYGGGENGHNAGDATVTLNRGTIGVIDTEDPWYDFNNDAINKKALITRGNVYGAGCGTDMYDSDGDGTDDTHNPKSGMVAGNTFVNIAGGHVGHSVYGGGSMGSVGTVISEELHDNVETGFALSWPYKFVFKEGTGKATINITGGHIGTLDLDGGDVFGSARGEAGDRYATAHMAYVGETEVNIDYGTTPSESVIQNILSDFTIPCVTGSVHGSGEDGYVYGDTHVTLNSGLIAHSMYGAGKGKGTYPVRLLKVGADKGSENENDYYTTNIYSLISGKVMGNTYVTMNGGFVGRNVYGGGNMASVGKGNFAGGNDDYSQAGYGEKIGGNLWTSATEGDEAWHFLNSGKTTVNVFGGQVGIMTTDEKNEMPYGNVFGGSAGEAAPNVPSNLTPRYHYCPAFFSGYVNETNVTIGGGYRCKTACTIGGKNYKVGETITAEQYNALDSGTGNWEAIAAPTILASVYGAGQDGHVRRDTKVTVNGGEIGLAYNSANQTALETTNLDSPQWLHRGNIYGAGSGISQYTSTLVYVDGYPDTDKVPTTGSSTSAGSVTRFTEVNVLGGTIHRNVYGGGSMGSVGAPKIGQDYDLYKKNDTADGHGPGKQSQCTVNIGGGPSVVTIGSPEEYQQHYGGEVYGASRGVSAESPLGSVVWTLVNVMDKAHIQGNVFGGGDAGMVKKDSEVIIGEKKTE